MLPALRCGIDQIEIDRVLAGMARFGERFTRRFFTEAERRDCGDAPLPRLAERYAARIAAKEAVAKALGTGIGPVSWREIEIRSGANGRPYLVLHGAAAACAGMQGLRNWDISLTHARHTACAMAVAWGMAQAEAGAQPDDAVC
jgi:holo-[acyl-carrier protein] synthase